MALYNTVRILEFVLNWGLQKTLGGMSGVASVCVRAFYKLTMQTIWNFQHFVSGMHSIYISPLITMKSKMCRSVLGQLKLD